MPSNIESLLAGRNRAPLTDSEVKRALATLYGIDRNVPVRYEEAGRTRFRVAEEDGAEITEVVFGPDFYPGQGVLDDNSALGIAGVAAHECTHFHRWLNRTELSNPDLLHIDEAMTSLEAILRYTDNLQPQDIRELIRDALQRLKLFAAGAG
jgi:hypothetical protein